MANRYSIETIFSAVDKISAPVSRMQKRIKDLTDSAKRGLTRASDLTWKWAKGLTAAGSIVSGVFVTAAAGMGLFVTETNKANQEMINMSKAMGVQYDTTKAMEGILGSMTMNWENFTDLIEEQANKFGELKGAGEMKKLNEAIALTGLNINKLKKMNPEQQFIAIADSLVKMKDGQKAAFIADEIWGGEGNKIIQGLRQRKMTVSQVIAEYQKYNFYTKEGQKATEDFNNAISPLSKMFQSAKSQIAAMVGGALVPYINKATEWAAANKELIQSKIAEWAKKFADGLAWVVTNMDKILYWAKMFAYVIGVFIALTAVLKTFVLVMTAVNLVMAANPIVLVVLAVLALVAAVTYVIAQFVGWEKALKIVGASILVMMGPIGWLIGAAILLYKNWGTVSTFFKNLWSGIVQTFQSAAAIIGGVIDGIMSRVTGAIDKVSGFANKVKGFFGFGGSAGGTAAAAGTTVRGPQQRAANTVSETRSTSEVTILDQTGRAKVTKGPLGNGLKLQSSGGF